MTKPRWLAAFALAAAVLSGYLAWYLQTSGREAVPISSLSVVVLVTAAVAVIGFGLPVRRWTSGDRSRGLDPLRAARVVALAQAAAYAGALFTGWYAGQGVGLVSDLAIEPRLQRFVVAMTSTGAALALTAAGLLVERWCRRPPDEDDEQPQARL